MRLAKVNLPELLADLPEWVTIGRPVRRRVAAHESVCDTDNGWLCAVFVLCRPDRGRLPRVRTGPTRSICDNNLLAASVEHFDRVCERLERHAWCDFNQGLDARLMNEHHAERIGGLRGAQVRLALDHSKNNRPMAMRIREVVAAWCAEVTDRLTFYAASEATRLTHGSDASTLAGSHRKTAWFHPLNASKQCCRATACGWDEAEKNRIMGYYYQHRGELPIVCT